MADLDVESSAGRIELANEKDFELGGLTVRPAERSVLMNGDRRELQPRVMQVLVALSKARPEVVSRDRLIQECWDGRIVGDDALNRCILVLRHLAEEFTPQPFAIETVPRVGHRLVVSGEEKVTPSPTSRRSRTLAAAVAFTLLLLAIAGYLLWHQRSAAPEPASIAVLPFRTVGAGDRYFAEGIGEEILGQLAREPHFRVAGSSSSRQFGSSPDIVEAANRLDVDYVLEGSVRRQGDKVRVNAGLVRASDGFRLWSDSYDGTLDDIFAIQRRIGTAIAGALERKLLRTPVLSGPLVTNGEAYNLYLTARGLIRTNTPRIGGTAANLLRDSIKIDPNYAPAWASLAVATHMESAAHGDEEVVIAIPKAQAYARLALRLAPELAEAHRALATVLVYGDPDGEAHFRRAAELDPNNAENLIGLGNALGAVGEFDRQRAVYRRAREIDPLWFRTTGANGIATGEMGDRAAAEAIARQGFEGNDINLHLLLGRIGWIFGDFSEAVRHWSIVARANSPRWSHTAQESLESALISVGLPADIPAPVPPPFSERYFQRIWMAAPPSSAVWQQRNRNAIAADVYRDENVVAAKLMLNGGRSRELIASFDGPIGLFGLHAGQSPRVHQLSEAAIIALALREVGRAADADRLLRQADIAARTAYRRNKVPFWFEAEAAEAWAAQGRTEEALAALERAVGRGWPHAGRTDLPDLNDEPAFRTIRELARFKAVAARLEAQYARERREIARLRRS